MDSPVSRLVFLLSTYNSSLQKEQLVTIYKYPRAIIIIRVRSIFLDPAHPRKVCLSNRSRVILERKAGTEWP